MNIDVYQIYFEHKQKNMLSPLTRHYFNEKLTPCFENDVIIELYNQKKIHDTEYFGILSWQVERKNGISIERAFEKMRQTEGQYNLYSFVSTVIRHHVLPMGSAYHQHFGYLFKALLKNLNLDFDTLASQVDHGFYQNAVIAHRDIYLDYVENWLLPSMEFIKTCDDIQFQQLLRSDPMYTLYPPGRQEKLMQHLGTPHYQYHTFILERLWSVYFQTHRYSKIKHCLMIA